MTTDDIKKILNLALEYYRQEVFGKFEDEQPNEEHRANWILERLNNSGPK